MREFPLIRTGRHIQFGPFRVDLDTGQAVTIQWPAGMDDRFPQGWRTLYQPAWSPVAYSSSTEGGVWAVQTAPKGQNPRGKPGAAVIFLDGSGEIHECVHISRPRPRFRDLIHAFGEWTLAFGTLLRGTNVIPNTPPVDYLEQGYVLMGPGGQLLRSDGLVFRPDRQSFSLFDKWRLEVTAFRASGAPYKDEIRFTHQIVGWDEKGLWILCKSAKDGPPHRTWISVVRLRDAAVPDSAERVWLREYPSDSMVVDTFSLHDGGWVAQIRDWSSQHDEVIAWLFHPPGADGLLEINPFAGTPIRKALGIHFAADATGGLMAVVDEQVPLESGAGVNRIWVWFSDSIKVRTFPVLIHEALFNSDISRGGWMAIPNRGGGPDAQPVLLRADKKVTAPPGLFTPRMLANLIEGTGQGWRLKVTLFVPVGDLSLVQAHSDHKDVFSLLRFQNMVPHIVGRIEVDGDHFRLLTVKEIAQGKMAIFQDLSRMPKTIGVLLSPDGRMTVNHIPPEDVEKLITDESG